MNLLEIFQAADAAFTSATADTLQAAYEKARADVVSHSEEHHEGIAGRVQTAGLRQIEALYQARRKALGMG